MKTSVIIPPYKAAAFIGRAIRSVMRQENAGEIEIIFIDDRSPGNLRNVVSGLPVIYLENPENIGPSLPATGHRCGKRRVLVVS